MVSNWIYLCLCILHCAHLCLVLIIPPWIVGVISLPKMCGSIGLWSMGTELNLSSQLLGCYSWGSWFLDVLGEKVSSTFNKHKNMHPFLHQCWWFFHNPRFLFWTTTAIAKLWQTKQSKAPCCARVERAVAPIRWDENILIESSTLLLAPRVTVGDLSLWRRAVSTL